MGSERISEIIRLASILSVAVPFVMYLRKIRYASKSVHLIGALTVVSALSDFIAYILFAEDRSTVILFNVYYTVVFFLLTWFYFEILLTTGRRTTVVVGLAIYLLSYILVTVYVQPYTVYQTFMWTITGLIMIIYSVSYFLHLFSEETMMDNYGLLWINSGILFYFSFNLFLFIIGSYVLTKMDPQISILVWSFHNVNNVIKNILLALGIASFNKDSGSGGQPYLAT